MTRERAIGYLAATRLSAAQFSGVFSDEFCDALEWAIHLLQKTENSSIDERSTTEWANIAEAPLILMKDDIRTEIANLKDEVDLLEGRIRKLERAFYGD